MKFSKSLFITIIAFITLVNSGIVQSSPTNKTYKSTKKTPAKKRKIKPIKAKKLPEGHSHGEQSYPGKTTYPVNTQALPTTWTSHMGNDW